MAILDAQGRPIDTAELAEPQTAQIAQLYRQFDNHPSRGLTPAKLARILEEAEQGNIVAQHELFMDMEEKDAHLFAEMSKRKRAILTLQWDIVPPRNATKAEEDDAAWLREVLLDFADLDDLFLDCLDGIGHGFSAIELEWAAVGKERLIVEAHHRPQSWFKLDIENRQNLRLRDNSGEGAELRAFGWIVHRHAAKSGYLARSGLHRVLAWPFLFKNYSVRDFAEFLEIFGIPLRIGKYPSGAQPNEKMTLLRAVTAIGHNAAGIMPEGMSIEIEEAAKGSADPFMAMIDWAERSESKAIVGQTSSSEAKSQGLGSGLANLHGEVRHDLLVSDAAQLGGSLTRQLLYPMLVVNRGQRDPRRVPRLAFDTGKPEDIKIFSDALPKLVAVGMPVPINWAQDKLRIPAPKDGEAVLAVPAAAAPLPPAQLSALLAAVLRAARPDEDEFDRLAREMGSDWQRVTEPLINPLQRLAEECTDLEEFRRRLPEAVATMDAAALAELLEQGNLAAALWGRVGT
jgi:phage gp29-like protein